MRLRYQSARRVWRSAFLVFPSAMYRWARASCRSASQVATCSCTAVWAVRLILHTHLSGTADAFRVQAALTAHENDALVRGRTWDETVPRDHL